VAIDEVKMDIQLAERLRQVPSGKSFAEPASGKHLKAVHWLCTDCQANSVLSKAAKIDG
jgi:hypothetical protein